MNLYWLTSIDCTEDWFVIAKSKSKAEIYFDNEEGFDIGDSKAELVYKIPNELIAKYNIQEENYAQVDLLQHLGGKIYSSDTPRIVNFNGRVFTEGHLTYLYLFKILKDIPGVYIINVQNTPNFKIGITKDLKKRISNFSTGNPSPIKIEYFIKTNDYKNLEKYFHELFKENRTKGEWFIFDESKIEVLKAILAVLHKSEKFFVYDIHGLYEMLNGKDE